MKCPVYRKYVCAAIFHRDKVLIFKRNKNWKGWELMKGGVINGEKLKDAVVRETYEETGQKNFNVQGTRHKFSYKWPKPYMKDGCRFYGGINNFFVIELNSLKVKIDKHEHVGYKWVSVKQALKMLTYHNHKRALKYALKVRK